MQFDGFDWDDGNWPKCGKHGVTKDEIEAAFDLPDLLILADLAHSAGEERFLLVVREVAEHHGLLVGFTWRERGGLRLVRPLTARYMHSKEVRSFDR